MITAVKQRGMDAADKTTKDVLPEGNPTGSNHYPKKVERLNLSSSSPSQRVKDSGIARSQPQKLDKLAQGRPYLIAPGKAGDLSTQRASIEARPTNEPARLAV